MKDTFLTFPEPLRKRILLQCAGAGLGITMLLILLVYVRDILFSHSHTAIYKNYRA